VKYEDFSTLSILTCIMWQVILNVTDPINGVSCDKGWCVLATFIPSPTFKNSVLLSLHCVVGYESELPVFMLSSNRNSTQFVS